MKAINLLLVFLMVLSVQITKAQSEQKEVVAPTQLPNESVVPVLDSPNAVRNRFLQFKNRFEASLNLGWMLDEPFFNNSFTGLELSYHLNEVSGVGMKFGTFGSGLSSYSKTFKDFSDTRYDLAPAPENLLGFTYNHRFLYGKISLSQDKVLPTVVEGKAELSSVKQGGQSMIRVAVGVVNKFYINKNTGLGLGYHFLIHESLNPNSVDLTPTPTPTPEDSDFSKRTEFSHSLDLNLSYLF